jgi:hypothetical protein
LTFAGPLADSLARSSRVATPVLPQARIQRDEAGQTELRPSSQPAGTLPLAPPAAAPAPAASIQRNATTTGQTRSTSAPSRTLPLAPVGQTTAKKDAKTETSDKDKVDLLTGLKEDKDLDAAADKTSDEMKEIDLDELADKVLPIVKRLIAIERERQDPI